MRPLSRSHAPRGNARWDALRSVQRNDKSRRRASQSCVPTRSVGTREDPAFALRFRLGNELPAADAPWMIFQVFFLRHNFSPAIQLIQTIRAVLSDERMAVG